MIILKLIYEKSIFLNTFDLNLLSIINCLKKLFFIHFYTINNHSKCNRLLD